MVNQKGQAQIKMCDQKEDPLIATLHNVFWFKIYAIGYFN